MSEISKCENRIEDEEGPVPGSQRHEFDKDELLPCHYFDFMYGTSTGALISILLARLRMTVPQCLEVYRDIGQELFGKKRNILPAGTKFYHKPMEKAVTRIVRQYCKKHNQCQGDDWHPWHLDDKDQQLPPTEDLGDAPSTNPQRICQS